MSNPKIEASQFEVSCFGDDAQQALTAPGVSASEAATILRDTFARSTAEVGEFLKDAKGLSEDMVHLTLILSDFPVAEVDSAMADLFGGSWVKDTSEDSSTLITAIPDWMASCSCRNAERQVA